MLTKDTERVWELGHVNEFPLAPGSMIFQGAAVGDNGAGWARPLVAGDTFLGFCEGSPPVPLFPGVLDTSEKRVRVLSSGLVEIQVAGLKPTCLQAPVYASDDDTFSLSAMGSPIGTVYRVLDNGRAIVAFGQCAQPPLTSHRLVFAGSHKTKGGAVMEKIAVPGLLETDSVQVTVGILGKSPCSLKCATPFVNSLHVTFDNDPSTDHLLHYLIVRSLAS